MSRAVLAASVVCRAMLGFINALIVEFLAGGGVEKEDSANSAMHYVLHMSCHRFTDSVFSCAKGRINHHIDFIAGFYLRVFQLVPHALNV